MSAYALINFPKLDYSYGLIDTSNRMKSCDALAVFPPPTPQESNDENRSNSEPGGGHFVFEKEKVMRVLDTRIDSVRLVKNVLASSSSSNFRKNKGRPSSLCKQLRRSPKQQQRRLHHSMSSNDRSKNPSAGTISWHNANPDYEDVMIFELSVPVDVPIKNETYMGQAVVFRSLSSLRELENDLLHWISSSWHDDLSNQEGATRALSFPRLPSIHEMVDGQNLVSHLPDSRTPVNWNLLLDIVPLLAPSIESWLNEVADFLFQENEHAFEETTFGRRLGRRGARSIGDNVFLAIWSNFFCPDEGSTNFSTRNQDFSSIIPCPSTLYSTEAVPLSRKRSSHFASIPEEGVVSL